MTKPFHSLFDLVASRTVDGAVSHGTAIGSDETLNGPSIVNDEIQGLQVIGGDEIVQGNLVNDEVTAP